VQKYSLLGTLPNGFGFFTITRCFYRFNWDEK